MRPSFALPLALVTLVAAQDAAAASGAFVVPPAAVAASLSAADNATVVTPTAAVPLETATLAPTVKLGFLERIAALGPQPAAPDATADVKERSFVDDLAEVYGPAGEVIRRAVDRALGRRDSHDVEQPLSVATDEPVVQKKSRDVDIAANSANATVANPVVGAATNNATAVAALKEAFSGKNRRPFVGEKGHRKVPAAANATNVATSAAAAATASVAPSRLGPVKIVTNISDMVPIPGLNPQTPQATGANGLPYGVVKRATATPVAARFVNGKSRAIPGTSLSNGAIVAPPIPSSLRQGAVKIVAGPDAGAALKTPPAGANGLPVGVVKRAEPTPAAVTFDEPPAVHHRKVERAFGRAH